MAAITICSDFGVPQNKVCHCFHCFPIYLPWSDGTRCRDLIVFWMLSFKPAFSLSSFTFIKRLFSSSISAIRVVSSAYLRLSIFLPGILIPACASSSLPFHMMYSAYKLNKQGDNIQPWHTLFRVRENLEWILAQLQNYGKITAPTPTLSFPIFKMGVMVVPASFIYSEKKY